VAKEIERKFVVDGQAFLAWLKRVPSPTWKNQVFQYYLSKTPEVRVRVTDGNTNFFCIKRSTPDPRIRDEVEFEIYHSVAKQLIGLATHALYKDRFTVIYESREWVVDCISRDQGDLWVAEIELKSPDEEFSRPDWLREEVTGRPGYSSYELAAPK
jgi:CYTH domain-containing protein